MNKENSANNIKELLKVKINDYYKKTTNKGRPKVLTLDECLDAIFLCSY